MSYEHCLKNKTEKEIDELKRKFETDINGLQEEVKKLRGELVENLTGELGLEWLGLAWVAFGISFATIPVDVHRIASYLPFYCS